MNSRKALELLIASGYRIVRQGKGSHIIMEKDGKRIIVSGGRQELSSGITKKVISSARK